MINYLRKDRREANRPSPRTDKTNIGASSVDVLFEQLETEFTVQAIMDKIRRLNRRRADVFEAHADVFETQASTAFVENSVKFHSTR